MANPEWTDPLDWEDDAEEDEAFTPGPWSWHQCYDHTGKRLVSLDIVPHGGHSLSGVAVLASVFSTKEADARLIAAAPALYEALDELMKAVGPDACKRARRKALAALSLALGERQDG